MNKIVLSGVTIAISEEFSELDDWLVPLPKNFGPYRDGFAVYQDVTVEWTKPQITFLVTVPGSGKAGFSFRILVGSKLFIRPKGGSHFEDSLELLKKVLSGGSQ